MVQIPCPQEICSCICKGLEGEAIKIWLCRIWDQVLQQLYGQLYVTERDMRSGLTGGGGNQIRAHVFLLCSLYSFWYTSLPLPSQISPFVWYATLNKIMQEKEYKINVNCQFNNIYTIVVEYCYSIVFITSILKQMLLKYVKKPIVIIFLSVCCYLYFINQMKASEK